MELDLFDTKARGRLLLLWVNFKVIKCEMKLLIQSQTSTVKPLKFVNGPVISSHTLLDMWLLIHAGTEV